MGQWPSTLPVWIAIMPLGCYLVILGLLHLRKRPLVLSGAVDSAALAAGLAGLLVVGPLALVEPAAGGGRWGWPVLAVLACLAIALAVLVSRPRVVVYNMTVEQLRPAVAEVVLGLDPRARWAGETVAMPGRGLQIHMDGGPSMRAVAVVAMGQRPSPEGWGEFCRRLRAAVAGLRVRPSPWSGLFLGCGIALLSYSVWRAFG